ncbi:hypothetical protein NKH80_15795 [Mesorhizobium sp. M0904]|uniref:hypothetical protein n=1 Tax=Mesorhizobium sp. M0904 TaxID=2957022 RepID=UPI00333AE01C
MDFAPDCCSIRFKSIARVRIGRRFGSSRAISVSVTPHFIDKRTGDGSGQIANHVMAHRDPDLLWHGELESTCAPLP